MSAPLGNANALTHGLTASRHHLTLGNMPKKLRKVQGHASALRRELEAAVVAVRGEITLLDAARIQTAVRLEATCQLARRWLMEALSELSEGERLAYLREIGRASIERDRVLERLGLDANETTTLEALYDAPVSGGQVRATLAANEGHWPLLLDGGQDRVCGVVNEGGAWALGRGILPRRFIALGPIPK